MPKYTSEKEMTKYDFGVTTYLTFKYEATRSSDATKVTFKLEPRIRYSGSTTSNAPTIFFNSSYPTDSSTSTVTTFTHSCACNKTYSSKSGGSYKYNWYGGTGTSTASSDTDYPVDGDAWVYGNWSSISVPVDVTKTSVTLYFNFANEYGYGNYENDGKGTTIWNGYAKKYRFGVTFEVPVGYTKNGSPTIGNTPELDVEKVFGNTDVASSFFTAKWTKPTIGTNNAISKYKIHVGVWGKPDGKTNGRVSYLYADNVSSSATSYKIERSIIKNKVGVDANTKYATSTVPAKYWECVDVQIEAVDSYGNSTYSAIPGWQVYWNEKPGSPTDIKIQHGTSNTNWTGNVVEMTDYYYSKIMATGSIDRWLPDFPSSYNEAKNNPAPYYSYLINRNSSSPSDADFTNNGRLVYDGGTAWLDDSAMLGTNPYIGLGPYYVHSKAWDGQLYSSNYSEAFYLGRSLVPLRELTIESDDGTHFSTLNPSLKLVIPPMCVDGYDAGSRRYYYPSGNVGIYIYASKKVNGNWTDDYEVYYYSGSAIGENTTVRIPLQNFWTTLLSGLQIDLTKPTSTQIRFSIYMHCMNETRLYGYNTSKEDANCAIQGATITGGLISADVDSSSTEAPLYYSYGQLTPYVTNNVLVKYSISGLPTNQYLTCYTEYADLGTSDSPSDTSVTWTPLTLNSDTNINSRTFVLAIPTRAYTAPVKLRLRVSDTSGNVSYIGLHWPSYSQATSSAEKCAASAIYAYKIPSIKTPSLATGELSIAEDDNANGNKVDFNFVIGDPLNYSDSPRFFVIDWYSLFKLALVGAPEYICGDGTISTPLIRAQYFSGANPGKYNAPTFSGHLSFDLVNQSGSFLLNGAKLKSSFDDSKEYNIIQKAVAFAANASTSVYSVVYCSEVLKTTPGWTILSDFNEDTDRLVRFTSWSINCLISSYANAKYNELKMSASEIKRKNGGALA